MPSQAVAADCRHALAPGRRILRGAFAPAQDTKLVRAKARSAYYFCAGAAATRVVGGANAVVPGASTAAVFTALPS